MKDLDPGRSGRENDNPETEGKPADRTTGTNDHPGGMQGSPSDRGERGQGQQRPHTDRNRQRDQQDTPSDRDRGMQGSPAEPARDRGMRDPHRESDDRSRAGSSHTGDELNDEDSAGEGGTGNRGASRGSDRGRDRNR